MPLTPVTWLDAVAANTTSTGNQIPPRVTQLANGNILVTWTSDTNTGVGSPAGQDIIGRLFDPVGSAIGTEFLVNSTVTSRDERDADVAGVPTSDGFVTVFESANNFEDIILTLHSADGAIASTRTLYFDSSSSAFPSASNPRVAVNEAGVAFAVFGETTSGSDSRIVGRSYDTATNTLSSLFTLIDAGGPDRDPNVAALSTGNFAIASVNNDSGDLEIVYRVVNASGGNVVGATRVAATDGDGHSDFEPSVTGLAGGGFVITWHNIDGVDEDIEAQVFNAAGTAISGLIAVTPSGGTGNLGTTPVVTALADGSFVIFYDDNAIDVLRAQHYSATGVALGAPFDFDGSFFSRRPDATLLGDGRIAVTYTNPANQIVLEILDTRDFANAPTYTPATWQVGTIGSDIFSGTASIIHGHLGSDSIAGNVGANTIFGGDGNDTINGGGGDDVIFGGLGEDYFDLGEVPGNDDYFGGGGIDTIDLTALLAVDLTVNLASETWSFGTIQGVEQVATSSGNDILIGNDVNNFLNGLAGNDALFGGPGNDSLIGDSGNDRLDGGAGDDTMVGGNGNDRYVVAAPGDQIIGEVGFAFGGGIDTVESFISFTLPTNVEILRLQGSANLSGTGNDAPEAIVGNTGANVILGRGGADNINGKSGNDTITGGGGNDTMVGESGADTFVYVSISDSYAGAATRDFINGFSHGFDRIDLSAIDANPFQSGDQAFTFLGSAPFTGAGASSAGQLRFFTFGGNNLNIIEADWNGDGAPEMQIFVNGTNFMTGTDFVL